MPDLILIVEDEKDVADLLGFALKNAGFNFVLAATAEQAIQKARAKPPALVLLDLMLPDLDGKDVCRTLKSDSKTSHVPIIMLTARAEETDRIIGLELGADDYITKPFSPREVVLRVKSVLRRAGQDVRAGGHATLRAGELLLDSERHEVTIKGKPVELTHTEFKLLRVLLERRGRVQTRERLLSDVWEYEAMVDTRTVDTHVRRLREKVGTQVGALIETLRGVGYRFAEADK